MAKDAKAVAVSLLAVRDLFIKQMRTKLAEKKFSKEEIDQVVSELEKRGYLCDEKLAKRKAEKYSKKGYGAKWIALKLKEESGKTFSNLAIAVPTEKVESLLRKYTLSDPKQRKRALAFLQRRGFSWEEVESFFTSDWQEL